MEPLTSPGNLTSTVSDELDRLEVRASKIGLITREQAVDLLHRLDAAYVNVHQLDLDGNSRKVAETQLSGIITRLHREGAQFIRDLGGAQALKKMREVENPPVEHSWWYLDEYVFAKRKASLRRMTIMGGIALAVLLALVVVYDNFLAPDPQVVALYGHQQSSQDYIMNGNLDSALEEANQGLEIDPADPELLVIKGIILEKKNRTAEAEEVFATAEKIMPVHVEFLATRGQAYLLSGLPEKALVDAQQATQEDPDYTQAYMISGQAYEFLMDFERALDDYDKAFDAAERANKPELAAIARTRMAMLMQTMNSQLSYPELQSTPTE